MWKCHFQVHVSTGVHQTVGPCDQKALDLAGQERQVYLCPETHTEDFTFDCTKVPEDMTEWYTVCGKKHSNQPAYLVAVTILAFIGITTYRMAFKPSEHGSKKSKVQ